MLDATPSNILNFGDNVTLECSARGGPDNVFQWQKNKEDLPGENQITLQFTLVSAADGGEYTCVVSNAAGNESLSVTLYLLPYITANPQSRLLASFRDNRTFNCEALGFPFPNYWWEKEGQPGVVSFEQNLVFGAVAYDDGGVYRCVASITLNMTTYTALSEGGILVGE